VWANKVALTRLIIAHISQNKIDNNGSIYTHMVDDNDNRDYGEKQEHDISSSDRYKILNLIEQIFYVKRPESFLMSLGS
jgi:hypothetical protein